MLYKSDKIINDLMDIPAAPYLTPASTRTGATNSKKLRQYSSTKTDTFKFSFISRTKLVGILCQLLWLRPLTWYTQAGIVSSYILRKAGVSLQVSSEDLELFRTVLVGWPYPVAVTVVGLVWLSNEELNTQAGNFPIFLPFCLLFFWLSYPLNLFHQMAPGVQQ